MKKLLIVYVLVELFLMPLRDNLSF